MTSDVDDDNDDDDDDDYNDYDDYDDYDDHDDSEGFDAYDDHYVEHETQMMMTKNILRNEKRKLIFKQLHDINLYNRHNN